MKLSVNLPKRNLLNYIKHDFFETTMEFTTQLCLSQTVLFILYSNIQKQVSSSSRHCFLFGFFMFTISLALYTI